ncbi:hypothetical protein VSDG_03178 [Cytospora chrysosperma]|uniref:Alcohol dehydrogenase-like C-terminal domain-containing protein n=1 Tax=Cytospora chrysosperma TaxID=252740 RepID=A0A423WB69_CYTCH|nr:hypothetical protein VSDG_03178 [Valsa sordida]
MSMISSVYFAKNVSFYAVDLVGYFSHRREKGKRLLHEAMELVADGRIHYPKPLHIYQLDAVEDAFRYFQSGKNTGRIIIRVNPSTAVQDMEI